MDDLPEQWWIDDQRDAVLYGVLPTDATTGNALASFLLGIPSSTSATSIVAQRSFLHNYDFYITDTFQATKKLTATAGLRWEQPGAYSEVNANKTFDMTNAVKLKFGAAVFDLFNHA